MLFAISPATQSEDIENYSTTATSSTTQTHVQQQHQQNKLFVQWKKQSSALVRRAASVGDFLLFVPKQDFSSSSSSSKKDDDDEHSNKANKSKKRSGSNNINQVFLVIGFLLLLSSAILLIPIISQYDRIYNTKENQIKLSKTLAALKTQAQWSEKEYKSSYSSSNYKKVSYKNAIVDEYGLPTLAAQCLRGVEWPLVNEWTKESLCEHFLELLPNRLRIHTFPLPTKSRIRYKSLRQLPTFNRGYEVEDYLVRWFADGPFSMSSFDDDDILDSSTTTTTTTTSNNNNDNNNKVIKGYLLPVQPYLDRVTAFPFNSGRVNSELGLVQAIDYIKETSPTEWKESKNLRVIVTVHDYGTGLANNIFLDEDDDVDEEQKQKQKSKLIDTAHFIVSNSENNSQESPFDANKDVSVVPSLSFYLPREAVNRGAVDLTHFYNSNNINNEAAAGAGAGGGDTYESKLDFNRTHRLMFQGNNRGPLRGRVFKYLIENKDESDSIETSGITTPNEYMKLMETSKFCLHVRGTRVMSPRLIELMLFGCVPVIVADAYELPLSWFLDWSKFSIRVPESEFENIHSIIENANWRELHSNLGRVVSFFVYHKYKPIAGDAFYSTALALLKRLESSSNNMKTTKKNQSEDFNDNDDVDKNIIAIGDGLLNTNTNTNKTKTFSHTTSSSS
jgi:hypothetical protein